MTGEQAAKARTLLRVGDETAWVYSIDGLEGVDPARLTRRPRTVRLLLENAVRNAAKSGVDRAALVALAEGRPIAAGTELPFFPTRVLLQDFTGVPVLVDLATLRSAMARSGESPHAINPTVPVDLIVDHSVQVDSYASPKSLLINLDREYDRNHERYRLLRWAKDAFDRLTVVPPGNGICHQVNLEHLATVVHREDGPDGPLLSWDTLIGTDSHTTMVNGLSVLGWGVGGIEAEAVLLGEPYFLPPPIVVGVELTGTLPEGATATDLVLTITHRLREHGVVDKFVEFCGPGVTALSVPDRATIANMCPEYGATAAFFPVDDATLAYLLGTGRPESLRRRVEAYAKLQGVWGSPDASELDFDERLRIDLGSIVPTIAGPKNPEESIPLSEAKAAFERARQSYRAAHPLRAAPPSNGKAGRPVVSDGSVVIAAITSCTNTSNPTVMVGAGLLARKARALGLSVPRYVKTSLAPGSKVVTAYLERAGLLDDLSALGFSVVGYGCTTCIGNSGPLPPEVAAAIEAQDAYVAAVLSGNRNFEARIHNQVRANYLASPMLVVAYALAGRMDIDLTREPLGTVDGGRPVFLKDVWPTGREVRELVDASLDPKMFVEKYRQIDRGDAHWEALDPPSGDLYPWDPRSTYVAEAPYLDLPPVWGADGRIAVDGARALAVFGDRVTTDHISPAGEIPPDTPAGRYLSERGVPPGAFNTYGSRRGHHEVLIRGTFANVRLRNELVAPKEGGWTRHFPDGEVMTIYDAAMKYRAERVPLLIVAGRSYGQGSSRDWAAKGPRLLGVGAVLAESFERIHRSNLLEMGVLPLRFDAGDSWRSLGWTGSERFALESGPLAPKMPVAITARRPSGETVRCTAIAELNSPVEVEYYRAGGILPYVMAQRFRRSPG